MGSVGVGEQLTLLPHWAWHSEREPEFRDRWSVPDCAPPTHCSCGEAVAERFWDHATRQWLAHCWMCAK